MHHCCIAIGSCTKPYSVFCQHPSTGCTMSPPPCIAVRVHSVGNNILIDFMRVSACACMLIDGIDLVPLRRHLAGLRM